MFILLLGYIHCRFERHGKPPQPPEEPVRDRVRNVKAYTAF
jgi:hypothetical protein